MNIQQLRYFIQINQLGSINKAAQKSNIAPQSISIAIKKLEDELECPLFIRDGKKALLLSDCGEIFLKTAKEVVSMIDHTVDQLDTLRATKQAAKAKESLNILVSPAFGTTNLPTIAKVFAQQYPHINLKIMQHETEEIQALLPQGNAVGIFVLFGTLTDTADLTYRFLRTDKVYIAISPQHPLAKQKSVSLKSLLQYPLAIYQSSYSCPNPLANILAQYGTPEYDTVTNNYRIYQDSIVNNHAIGFNTKSAIKCNTAFPEIQNDIITMPVKNMPLINVYMGVEKKYFAEHAATIETLIAIYLSLC